MLNRIGRRGLRLGWPRFSVSRISLVLGAFGLASILATAGFIAWREREADYREARASARNTAFSLADHAARLFEVADLALRATTQALGDEDWTAAAASPSLWAEMRASAEALPYIGDLWLNDETGRLRVTSVERSAPPASAADRPIFASALAGDRGLLVGDPFVGRVTGKATFPIARRLETSDGLLRGMVSATAELSYFTDYWHRLDLPEGEDVAIVRPASGSVLIAYPDAEPVAASLADELARAPETGRYTPEPGRSGFYHRVGDLPLYLTVAFRHDVVERGWRNWLAGFLLFPAAAIVALGAIMGLARRQSLVEALASRDVNRARAQLASANERLEQRVAERTADLSESHAEVQRFAYIVSHDLRAPLVNITGFTSELQRLRPILFPEDATAADAAVATLSRDAQRELRQDFDEAIGFIQSSIDKMDRLINAILLLARQGSRPFEPEPVDTEALMRSVADGVAHRLQSAGARLAIGPLPPLVVDRVAFEQVFSNLVDNAVKYLRAGTPGEVAISGHVEGAKAVFSVADNGRGIDPRDHGRVFELFRRSGPQDRPGDGIGLAHVKTMVRQLGGTISVASAPGLGSTFTVILPLQPDRASP